MFFTNYSLVLIWKYLSYKNIDEIKSLLTELSYSKVTWQTRGLNIRLDTTDIIPKNILYTIYILYQKYNS